MIELYTWTTPNGRKASIMLEEIGLPYTVRPINLGKNEQFDPAFLKISPNNKIPAIVDEEAPGGPLAVFESGAILIYLAEKTGRLLAKQGAERYKALEWLNWQMGGIGPMFGQLGFFAVRSTDKAPLAITRFTEEGQRLARPCSTDNCSRALISPARITPSRTSPPIPGCSPRRRSLARCSGPPSRRCRRSSAG